MLPPTATAIEIHRNGAWHRAAELVPLGDDRCRVEYLAEYIFGEANPWPIAMNLPPAYAAEQYVEGPAGPVTDRRPPPFLYDLVPQGRGRKYLIGRLGLSDHENLILPLVMAGAFNPIGNLRLSSAVDFFGREAIANPEPANTHGFTKADVIEKSADFLEHLALHAMLASGTTGVQGVAPKFLLTTDRDGQWFADMALPDDRAHEHWLLKLPRGKGERDKQVLRNEAAYLRLAKACGIRTHRDPELHGDVLFVRRFDREIVDGKLQRLHQESAASICGLPGFGTIATQQTLLAGIRGVVAHPLRESIEFIKRDVLNQAMRNTDNHARNTAVQRLPDGSIQLTPLFDFAPMFLDEEGIARGFHWRDGPRRQDNWAEVIGTLNVPDAERTAIAAALHDFATTVARLPEIARDCGIEDSVIAPCLGRIAEQADQLGALPGSSRHG